MRNRTGVSRAQANMAVVVMVFFASIVAAALVWLLLEQAAQPMLDMARTNASTAAASSGISDATTAWSYARLLVLVLAGVLGLAGAAAVSRR